jgi:deoxycytidylate deaminase
MPSPQGDPTYIKNKETYFINLAKQVGLASTHPSAPGGCIVVRDREIIGDGRSLLTDSQVEIDCICYAIAAAAKRGTPTAGAVIYTTRYPFSASVFQCHVMGIKKIIVLAHQWEPYYKHEFRRAGRIARELSISIEAVYENEDPRFAVNQNADRDLEDDLEETSNPHKPDDYDPKTKGEIHDDD